LHTALSGLFINWSSLAILLIAIPLVNRGSLNGVYLALLVLASMASFEAVLPLAEAAQQLERSLAAARRLFEIVNTAPAITEPAAASPSPQNHSLVIKHLHFRYQEDEAPALADLNLSLPEGQAIAIVGPSRAGKSTLVKLLLRFWEYERGQIILGGMSCGRIMRTRPAG
jgi:ABC-type transport system involved in cytochrome bd biosynthesis fused ATPase/permease subunit